MYVKFGDTVKCEKNLVGFFDIDNATYSKTSRDFLSRAEKEQRMINLSTDIPSTFVLSSDKYVYLTRCASKTLKGKRV